LFDFKERSRLWQDHIWKTNVCRERTSNFLIKLLIFWILFEEIVLRLRFLIWCRRWRTIRVRCSLCRCRVSLLNWHSSNMKSRIIIHMSITRTNITHCSDKAQPLLATDSIAIFISNKVSAHDLLYSPAGRRSLYLFNFVLANSGGTVFNFI
jgi:hypothetical protein